MQVVVGTKNGETHTLELEGSQEKPLIGMKMGDEFDGSKIGLQGYRLEITGGSDSEGFPMRKKLDSTGRKEVLVRDSSGKRSRKSFRGNTVSESISQINCKVVEEGSESVDQIISGESEEQQSEQEEQEAESGGDEADQPEESSEEKGE